MSQHRLNQLSFWQLVFSFAATRGGWIVVSFVWALALRFTLFKINGIDILLILLIVSAWPILEWFFHRFLMHEWTLLPFHQTHDRHHRFPSPETGLPDTWIVVTYFILPLMMWSFGLRYLLTLGVTVLAMLVVYEFVHFSCHCNYTPLSRWGWAVRVNHLQHHKLDETTNYAMLFPRRAKRRD